MHLCASPCFKVLLHGRNAERIVVASAEVGFGMYVLENAAAYARERIVFGRPIGQNQAIQHPLVRTPHWFRPAQSHEAAIALR
ncbi:acyl-CoA/acyl-ACP dehydrogenase [Sulfitobacter pseudonitzschiae]|uniref:Acyl-CoA/acyl-ACP dehydrogenase n=2 Tax=Roseobacteraceae TaxID=2854170 RepID=A0A9Q2N9X5_9RHOB|nr:acyl-CoA/acyl-ACP dehydrogenase [Pseudosulfitobacter pseudonitzschiae]MBM1833900.1 acyl-CoA/acyl-ACP dehydrogenase [Pseudosulfitobacter pseudonitzschiae]MBM1838766.1 acyl-CoA/acyl-ACP dehydrogenase [Pseudosulfitobacter pseudonitzschiae]MBM1843615.1 acyl-CoA/acyl-ACP dehydrogenase [Pseudosulfitobacter pseudonitzschiae]MBM1848480.1 acyl-CoA/acyl-ACP dehydrogenase [Pseudosulfitobacter pseudonitzschiae]